MSKTRLDLPTPRTDGPVSLEATIAKRRSVRNYTPEVLTLDEIGQLLWSAQGITGSRDVLRAAPSAGGRHPLFIYVCRKDGVWRYHPKGHYLTLHLEEDVREALVGAAWRQKFIANAPCVFVVSAVFTRTTERYSDRGRLRYVPMDVGHASQNLLLQAAALDLGGVTVGAFTDEAVEEAISLPEQEVPMYIIPVGHPK